jgi:outer membrane protein OmpA-like peptidoglycan-associated protein
LDKTAGEDSLGQILAYNEADERVLVGTSRDAKPSYYVVFVTSYRDGVIPERLAGRVEKGRAIAHVTVITPDVLQDKMTFVNAGEMQKTIQDSGRIALYGVYFDSDKDLVRPESEPTLSEIGQLMKSNPALRLHIVGHTDNQGRADYNLDLSRRRAASVVRELTEKHGIAVARLDSFGCGLYAPVASNETDEGRAKNRRVELVSW